MAEIKEGWAWSGSSKKQHYFRKQGEVYLSLCGKWLQFQDLAADTDCRACRKRLEKEGREASG